MTKQAIDRLATRIWYQAVEDGLGLDSPYAVELFLEGDRVKPDGDGIKRPRKWRNYCDGRRTPDDIPGTLNVFDIAEYKAPGTARWFRTSMWKALKGKIRSPDDLRRRIAGNPALREIVLCESSPVEFDMPAQEPLPGLVGSAPFITFETDRIGACIDLHGLDLLEAIVFLLEYGHLAHKPAITSKVLELLYGRHSKNMRDAAASVYPRSVF